MLAGHQISNYIMHENISMMVLFIYIFFFPPSFLFIIVNAWKGQNVVGTRCLVYFTCLMIDSVMNSLVELDSEQWTFTCDTGNRSLSQHLTRPLKIASLDVPITYYYFIRKVLGGFLFFLCWWSCGEICGSGVSCSVDKNSCVKLELKNDFLKIKEIKMCLFCARSIWVV